MECISVMILTKTQKDNRAGKMQIIRDPLRLMTPRDTDSINRIVVVAGGCSSRGTKRHGCPVIQWCNGLVLQLDSKIVTTWTIANTHMS